LNTPSFRAATAPRIMTRVFTGKNGFAVNRVMPCRATKRAVSSRWYSGLLLIPARLSAGERLFVSLNTPPRSTGMYSNRAPVLRSTSGITRWLR
jgi:hypothetical protein